MPEFVCNLYSISCNLFRIVYNSFFVDLTCFNYSMFESIWSCICLERWLLISKVVNHPIAWGYKFSMKFQFSSWLCFGFFVKPVWLAKKIIILELLRNHFWFKTIWLGWLKFHLQKIISQKFCKIGKTRPGVDFIKAKSWTQSHFTLCTELLRSFLGVKVWCRV